MDGDGLAYFVDWQNTISRIANESLRKKAQKRLEDVRASFDKVKAKLQNASAQFKPFLSDLGDIQKALAADVTPGGVKAIKNVVSSANRNYEEVNKTINAALLEMDKMEKALTSEAK
jgi:phage-related tail protein